MEKSFFKEAFGNDPKVKLWDYLLDNDGLDFCKQEIAKECKMSRTTLDKLWGGLIKNKIIIMSRQVGRAVMFKLNRENPTVRSFLQFDNILCRQNNFPEQEQLKPREGKLMIQR